MLGLIFTLFIAAFGQYDILASYNNQACTSGSLVIVAATLSSLSCEDSVCVNCSGGGIYGDYTCLTRRCNVPIPSLPYSPIQTIQYASTNCTGSPTSLVAVSSYYCINNADGTSQIYGCTVGKKYTNPGCTGLYYRTSGLLGSYGSSCYTAENNGVTSSILSSCPYCFHADTTIVYEGQSVALKDIKKNGHASCVIPHEYTASGYKITTSCPGVLRLTAEHLVYTHNGLVMASQILPGDFLYSDLAEKQVCVVNTIELEEDQLYYGLNCEESVVLADGYKTSTFGLTHALPATWMKYASKFIGIERASAWGDALASIFAGLF